MHHQTHTPSDETHHKKKSEEGKVTFGDVTVLGVDQNQNFSKEDNNSDDDDDDDGELKYVNHDVCDCCGETGNLICCDSCPTSLHFDCSDPPVIIAPEGKWFCPKCMFIRKEKKETFEPYHNTDLLPVIKHLQSLTPTLFTLPSNAADHSLHQRRRGGRHLRDVECCELQNGEAVQCKMCSRRYHLKCLEPPLLVQPGYFECELHLRDDERCNTDPTPTMPAAFTDSLLQSKVKIDFDIPPFIERSMLGDEINTPNINNLKEILLDEVNGEEADRFLENVTLPPPLSSNDGEKGYLKYVFLSQFESEEMTKDWSSNVILFKQFHEWLDMLRTAKKWKALLLKIASTPEGIKKLNALRPYSQEVQEPEAKKPCIQQSSSYESGESFIKALAKNDLDSPELKKTYKAHILFAAKFRKAVEEFKKSGNYKDLNAFPALKKLLGTAQNAASVTGPRIAFMGRVIATFKSTLVIGRGKGKNIGLNLGKLFGESTVLAMSHTHATINASKTLDEFVITVSGINGLYVDEVYVPQGGKAKLNNGSKITIFFIDYYFYK